MAPPTWPLNLDVEAISGICGSISIACWVVVFSPQIVENFRRSSADGLSIQFIVIWLLGDVFNILGAVLQGVLPTMIILAIYYTIADVVLLAQCFFYRGFTLRDHVSPPPPPTPKAKQQQRSNGRRPTEDDNLHERTRLLEEGPSSALPFGSMERRGSWTHLSPAVPLVADVPEPTLTLSPPTKLQTLGFNTLAVFMVCAAGAAGWWLSRTYSGENPGHKGGEHHHDGQTDPLRMDFWGQIFGWLCAALYLGSRLPQLLLNWRRKSTEGVSILFFLFACLGNLTYVLSIMAYDPECELGEDEGGCRDGEAARVYWEYILVNLSWIAGSAGTLFLDLSIFVQFFIYSKSEDDVDSDDESGDEEESIEGDDAWDDPVPVLQRNV